MSCDWIWLPEKIYPMHQNTKFDALSDVSNASFVVAEFKRAYEFAQNVRSISVTFSADTQVQLFCNRRPVATGPVALGGDFLGCGRAREWYYASEVTFPASGRTLDFFARVKMCPSRMCEFSKGHGGFMLQATVTFEDGSTKEITTDGSWLVRKNAAYVKNRVYDGSIAPDAYVAAEPIPDIWRASLAPIPVREEKELSLGDFALKAGEEITKQIDLDWIYAGFFHLISRAEGAVRVSLVPRETDEEQSKNETATLQGEDEYRSFWLHSAGNIILSLKNETDRPASVALGFITTCYPVTVEAKTRTSDGKIDKILDVCRHTLRYCRQTIHLDSPKHCEPLACTGDYYIEALMSAFSFGDMRLAAFDVVRTAEHLRHNDGRMFHTTYSLIWVRMLYDVYMPGGDLALLERCRDALDLLLARFATYVGKSGLVENPPDYMFVDWIYIDGLSMHHPPKALGQTVLNMFYFMALDYAGRIYALLGEATLSAQCAEKKQALRRAVNTLLYDGERGMYFEGLNEPIAQAQINAWQPRNTEKRYYLKHSNILAAYTGICDADTAVMLIEKIMGEEIAGDVQPYFLHYLFEAIYTHGLREKYTLPLIARWMPSVAACDKGLPEGFFAPEPTYRFDHSHAWGGSPLYSLPKALTGLEITGAGYKSVKLSPALLGLERASVEIPTPYGMIVCEMEKGKAVRILAPREIEIEVKESDNVIVRKNGEEP